MSLIGPKNLTSLAFVIYACLALSEVFALPKKPFDPTPTDTSAQNLPTQKAVFRPTSLDFDDMVNINASAPANRLAPNYSPGSIGAQRPLYPSVGGVPYVNVRRGHPETAGGNNHMRRQVKASPSGVVHMAYRVFDADTGSGDGSYGDTVYNPADSSTNGIYFFNSYDCGGSNELQCSYTGSNGKCYIMIRPPDPPETRPSKIGAAGGLFVRPSSGRPVVYGRRIIERYDVAPHGVYSTRGWATALEGAECTPLFWIDTSYTAVSPFNSFDPVMHPLDDNVWVVVLAHAGDNFQLDFSYTTDAGASWSPRVALGTSSPWYNSVEIASSGNTFWIVSMADPADPTAFQTTERPVYLKGTYTPGPNTVTFGTMQDITGSFELPSYLGNMLDIAATNIGDTLVVAWDDWNNFLGNGFAGPGGHVHSALIFPDGSTEVHKVANIDIDGRLPKITTTAFYFGLEPWSQIELSYDASGDNLYCIWEQPPPDGNFGWADYERTQTLAVNDLFRSTSPNHGRTWDNPENITRTNNPGCSGAYGDECANEYWFSADDRASNDTIAIVAVVNAYPGIQESAEGITPGDIGPFTRSRDLFRLYKMPARPANQDLRGDLSNVEGDTIKFNQVKLRPGGSSVCVFVKLQNIGLQGFFLDSVRFDSTFNSSGLVTTTNALFGYYIPIGGSYPFQVCFDPSGVNAYQQGLHAGFMKAYLRSAQTADRETIHLSISLYVVQTLCFNRKVRIHSGNNSTDVGSQGTIKDQAGYGLHYDFDGSDRFYDGGLDVANSRLNAAAGVPGVPRKVSHQLLSNKFLRCLTDIVLDSTPGTGSYYNLYAKSVATDVEDSSLIWETIWEQCTHPDSSDFLLQTVQIANLLGYPIDSVALGVLYDIDVQGGGSSASENVAGDTSVTYNGRKFWLGYIAGNDWAVDTCTPNNSYYGVVVIPSGLGNPGDSIHPRGAVMCEQRGFSFNIGNGNAAGGDSLHQRYMWNLNVCTSAPRREQDTLTGVWRDTLGSPQGFATICGGVANPTTYRDVGPPYRNDMGYVAVAKKVQNLAASAEASALVSRFGLEGAAAQLAAGMDSSFPGNERFEVIHVGSVSGLPDLMNHAVKGIDWYVKHKNYQVGGHIDLDTILPLFDRNSCALARTDMNCNSALTPGDAIYLISRCFVGSGYPTCGRLNVKGDLNCDGFWDAADFWLEILAIFASRCEPCPLVRPTNADSRDSIIIESKTVTAGGGSGYMTLRVWVTNKDSIVNLTLPYVEQALSGEAYALVSYPRTFNGTINPLTSTFAGYTSAIYSRYNNSSPDSVFLISFADSASTFVEAPNFSRKPIWDLKFDSVFGSGGQFFLDSIRVLDNTIQFVGVHGQRIPVNFVPSIVTVEAPQLITNCNNAGGTVGLCQPYTFDFDADRDVTWSMVNGPGIIDPNTGVYSFSGSCASGLLPMSIRATYPQFRTFRDCEFLLNVVESLDSVKFDYPQTTYSCGKSIPTQVGSKVEFTLQVSNVNPSRMVWLTPVYMPAGARMAPDSGNPARSTFLWIPTSEGNYSASFLASNIDGSNPIMCTYAIEVAARPTVCNPVQFSVLVSDFLDRKIYRFNNECKASGAISDQSAGNFGEMVIDTSGNIFVADQSGKIFKFKSNGNLTQIISSPIPPNPVLNGPWGMAISSMDSNVFFVTNMNSPVVHKFSTQGNFLGVLVNNIPSSPTGIAFDVLDNHMYVAGGSAASGQIAEFDPTGTYIRTLAIPGGVLKGPHIGLAFRSPGSYLYASSEGTNTILELDPVNPNPVRRTLPNSALMQPQGISFEPGGDMFVASYGNGAVFRFALPNFTLVDTCNFGLLSAPSHVVSAVTKKGDLNQDKVLSPADLVYELNCVYLGIPPSLGDCNCDLNCDGLVRPLEIALQLNAIYLGRAFPCN